MLLTIRSKELNSAGTYSVQLSLSYSGKVETYVAKRYAPVVSRHLKQSLNEYCMAIVGEQPLSNPAVNFGEKYLSVGHRIADQLMGDDFQLIRFREIIEDVGYAQLDVVIESSQAEFLEEVWDSLILPGSKYIISTVSRSFQRLQLTQDDASKLLNHTTDSSDETVTLSRVESRSETLSHAQRARILYGMSRPHSIPAVFAGSDVMRYVFDSLSSDDALTFDIRCGHEVNGTLERCENKSFDIFHYDGPFLLLNDTLHFVFEDVEGEAHCIDIETMATTLSAKGIKVVFLQATTFYDKQEGRLTNIAQSDLAASLLSHQIENVLVFPFVADPAFNRRAYHALYRSIAAGIALSSAIVEVKKALQSHLASNSADARLLWSTPVLYSTTEFRFSKSPATDSADTQQEALPILRKKLFGFQSEMLPPLLSNASDGVAFDMIRIMQRKSAVLLSGEEGIGKRHNSHLVAAFLALQKQIDFAFYFDSRYASHSVDDMNQMIKSVFVGSEYVDRDIRQILQQHRCLFIIDQATHGETEMKSAMALAEFVNEQIQQDNHVIVIGGKALAEFIHSFESVDLVTLPAWAQHELLTNEQQRLGANNPILTIDSPLIKASRNNPWLIRKLLPQCVKGNSEEALSALAIHCHASDSIKHAYFDWQWHSLSPCARFLLKRLGEQPGIMLELLMIVFERAQTSSAVTKLKELCADNDFDFSRFLQHAEPLGLLKRMPHARFIDSDLADYLSHSAAVLHEKSWENADLSLCFSQLVAEGVRAICGHVLQAHNPHILNNLLIHRRIWASHLELLYKNSDFQRFFSTKKALDAVLQFAGLSDESHAWALALLDRSPIDALLSQADYQAALAWCTLALSINRTRENLSNATLIGGAQSVARWLESLPANVPDSLMPLFRQGVIFCDLVQRANRQWPECIKLMTKVLPQFYDAKLTDDVRQTLRSLVHCYTELGEFSKATAFEDQLLAMMAATAVSEQSSFEQTLELVTARLMRGDHAGAGKLLQQIQQQEHPESNRKLIDALHNEIGFRQGRYADVLPYYCQAWAQAVRLNLHDQLEKLRVRFQVLESELGKETVVRFLRERAPDGIDLLSPTMTIN